MADEKNGATENTGEPQNNQAEKPAISEELKKFVQSETDKVRTEYVKKLKALEEEKENLLKEKMSEKEKAEFELQKKAKEIEEREKELSKQSLTLKKMNLLKDNTELLDLEEFIIGENEDQIKANIGSLKTKFNAAVQREVEKRFKDSGREPTHTTNNPPDQLVALKAQYNEAMKAGNTLLMVTLKNQIAAMEK